MVCPRDDNSLLMLDLRLKTHAARSVTETQHTLQLPKAGKGSVSIRAAWLDDRSEAWIQSNTPYMSPSPNLIKESPPPPGLDFDILCAVLLSNELPYTSP
ncbi:hypothetical protein MBM_02071 [Drepanopeziza brunnea f. sp. 'multigermtubi' MB_m1]|uniref:Uncharacterized protein n=1 Tax=Marssonina brunnea f. sp. multigermtubi (strain MB_m1) TaxID=1072389 RepID=K1Y4Q2_MARBU|nr:uncharacterized protein MBM_02071 [Drepanopeziza brunnea f. sp. 'multigermtubi' MB_m1]EKD20119.1 hypothetical protein MBM_02071 [Drepanopeziza brunnea f. sp. 'multigermtubi' MB_m1]